MAPPRNPNYVYAEDDVRKKHAYEKKTCPQCKQEKLIAVRSTHCSKSCALAAKHAQGIYKPKTGPESPNWKGDKVSYTNMHTRIYRARGKAASCSNRESAGCTSTNFEWAHLHETDPYNPANYIQLCASCHRVYDASSGAKNPLARLTMEQARAMRAEYASTGCSQRSLAMKFGISQTVVSYILTGKRYKEEATGV